MIDIKTMLEQKWGSFIETPYHSYVFNAPMPFVSSNAKLNVLFNPRYEKEINNVYNAYLQTDIPNELIAFYQKFNGVRLFANSLSVYGIQESGGSDYQPYDILMNNWNNNDCNKHNLVFVASVGGQYDFGFKRNEVSKIYGIKVGEGDGEILQTFESFDVFFEHYFNYLINEYDNNARKIHPNMKYKGIPCLEHLSYELK